MDIRPHRQQVEQLERKRQLDRQQAPAGPTATGGADRSDQARLQLDPEVAKSYVARLKQEDPARLHRVAELKGAIADGSYGASPEELADRLLEALDRGTLD